MARQKAMTDSSVVCTDEFEEMSKEAQLLYFHLAHECDRDGAIDGVKRRAKLHICEPGEAEAALQELHLKGYLIDLEGITFFDHYRINNSKDAKNYTLGSNHWALEAATNIKDEDHNPEWGFRYSSRLSPDCQQTEGRLSPDCQQTEGRLSPDSNVKNVMSCNSIGSKPMELQAMEAIEGDQTGTVVSHGSFGAVKDGGADEPYMFHCVCGAEVEGSELGGNGRYLKGECSSCGKAVFHDKRLNAPTYDLVKAAAFSGLN